jgi:hypothetical protein
MSGANEAPTYVTYVLLRRNSTGTSNSLTISESTPYSISSPTQQRIGVKEGQEKFAELAFELLDVRYEVHMVGHCIPQFRAHYSKLLFIY